jgi:hypothetical protein
MLGSRRHRCHLGGLSGPQGGPPDPFHLVHHHGLDGERQQAAIETPMLGAAAGAASDSPVGYVTVAYRTIMDLYIERVSSTTLAANHQAYGI